jgi:hypothetical protein
MVNRHWSIELKAESRKRKAESRSRSRKLTLSFYLLPLSFELLPLASIHKNRPVLPFGKYWSRFHKEWYLFLERGLLWCGLHQIQLLHRLF